MTAALGLLLTVVGPRIDTDTYNFIEDIQVKTIELDPIAYNDPIEDIKVIKDIKVANEIIYKNDLDIVEPENKKEETTENQQVEIVSDPISSPVEFATSETRTYANETTKEYTIDQFEYQGIINWGGYRFSYYSERVLPGPGLNIPGRHTADGFVRDENGYLVLAANNFPKGSIHPTPFGMPGIVRDYCAGCWSNQLDVYTR